MPAGTPRATVDAAVGRTLRLLNLEGVADVIVGGGANAAASISGGQLKRVSVGVELVSEPRVLILDGAWVPGDRGEGVRIPGCGCRAPSLSCAEPTSGLDATAALSLAQASTQRLSYVRITGDGSTRPPPCPRPHWHLHSRR